MRLTDLIIITVKTTPWLKGCVKLKMMKRRLFAVVTILLSLTLFFSPGIVLAQECTGQLTGFQGDCQLLCGPNKRADGGGGCGFLQKCCVSQQQLPGTGKPCAGATTGKLGTCQTGSSCAQGQTNDGRGTCSPGQTCCVDPSSAVIQSQVGGTQELTCQGGEGINTAIGCIPISDSNALIGFLLRWAIGVGGGIAFLLIVVAGFQIMTSTGNPERLKAGQELMTSAIAGLIMLIFSVFILRIIGIDILRLPGLI